VRLTGSADMRPLAFMVRELRLMPVSPSDVEPQR
jgi:hypothetical protein